MSKPQPPFVPGEIFHVYNHANGFENIFTEEDNYRYFLEKCTGVCDVVDMLAYCLLPNHFHLLVKVKSKGDLANFYMAKKNLTVKDIHRLGGLDKLDFHTIVRQPFSNFLGGYVTAFNRRNGRNGSLLQQNTKRKVVGTTSYFANAIHYIHYNAVHHGFVSKLENWPHSSYHAYLSDKPTRLARDKVLGWFGGLENFKTFHQSKPSDDFDFDIIFE